MIEIQKVLIFRYTRDQSFLVNVSYFRRSPNSFLFKFDNTKSPINRTDNNSTILDGLLVTIRSIH